MITFQRASKAAIKWASFTTLKMRGLTGAERHKKCPACHADVVGFFRYGHNPAWGCPACGASPRQRLVCYLIDSGVLTIPAEASVLHIAPNEAGLVTRFQAHAREYVPADLYPDVYDVPGVVELDLMQMDFRNRFDILYASHVMEHVTDDARVLRNMFAALKPGGEAWLIVAVWGQPTEDGHPAMSPGEREKRFGQWDHVRQYGPDFADRIRHAGFALERLDARDVNRDVQGLYALDDVVFCARKPLT